VLFTYSRDVWLENIERPLTQVIGKRDGSAHGGHLLKAHVWPTLELFLTETSETLQRKVHEETNLALIAIEQ